MLKFNNNNIFTGYLKQLLTSFNLPKYRIYTVEQQKYHEWAVAQHNPKIPLEKDVLESVIPEISPNPFYPDHLRLALYLKDNQVKYYTKNKNGDKVWINTPFHYHENKKELNQTKNFIIKNNIYDTYTHEYLGDFLRFVRDYYDINLMPLYNCFSNKLCSNLKLEFNSDSEQTVSFDSSDTNFKIYMLPVKLFKQYTIAIDSNTPIEMCCGFFGSYLDKRTKIASISEFTYKRINTCMFSSPFIYDALLQSNLDSAQIEYMELAQNEPDLKLFIKVPTNNQSSIVILEGNYLGYNNSFFNKKYSSIFNPELDEAKRKFIKINNHYVTNYAKASDTRKDIPTVPTNEAYIASCEISTELEQKYEDVTKWKKTKYSVKVIRNDGIVGSLDTLVYQNIEDPTIFESIIWGLPNRRYYIKKDNTPIDSIYFDSQNSNWKTPDTNNYFYYTGQEEGDPYKFTFKFRNVAVPEVIQFPEISDRILNPITNLQLLSINTGVSYPFSDTLIEYLSGNVITPQDKINDNVKRTQYIMNLNHNKFPIFGAWDNSIKNIIYDYMSNLKNKKGTDIDVLGYIDKNAEKYYAAKIYENGKAKTCTISNVDIYKDPYLDDNWRN